MDEKDRGIYIQRKKKEEIQNKHRIIKATLKEDQVALTCVEMWNGMMKTGKEMITALVNWNRQYF